MSSVSLNIQEDVFNPGFLQEQLLGLTRNCGGFASFTGYVRPLDLSDAAIISLYIEHYPGMTEKAIKEILRSACQRWNIEAISVVHRVGQLFPRQPIVWIGACAPHRGDAFSASEFVMDFLKTRAPFWKKEVTADGATWIDSHDSDLKRIDRWSSEQPT